MDKADTDHEESQARNHILHLAGSRSVASAAVVSAEEGLVPFGIVANGLANP